MSKLPCVVVVEHLGESLGEYCYQRIARAFDSTGWEYHRIDATRGAFPHDVSEWRERENVRAVVFDGSCQSPLDNLSWMHDEADFIRQLVPSGIPTLAICFGHEILAWALGGKLRLRDNYEVAMHEIEVLHNDPIFGALAPRFRMPVAHRVEVERPAPGFELIATAQYSSQQVLRHVEFPVYSVQFHPEVDTGIKKPDPDWNAIPDDDFHTSDGDKFMANFATFAAEYSKNLCLNP